MACPECSPDCSMDDPCECDCHDEESTIEARVMDNQTIEYETDVHMPDSGLITKTRIVVTGRDTNDAYKQFTRVRIDTKT
jgi:hypothetical protein